jgi:hypothetical protein
VRARSAPSTATRDASVRAVARVMLSFDDCGARFPLTHPDRWRLITAVAP